MPTTPQTRTTLMSLAAVLLLIGAGCSPTSQVSDNADDAIDTPPANPPVMQDNTMGESTDEAELMKNKNNAMMQQETEKSALMEKNDTMKTTPGSYTTYSPEKIAQANNNKTILFFHATWCPSCRTLDKDIQASVSDIPAGVTILKTDYDSHPELKKKYGVTYQHTFVQVDADGNEVHQWSGGSTLEDILKKLKS